MSTLLRFWFRNSSSEQILNHSSRRRTRGTRRCPLFFYHVFIVMSCYFYYITNYNSFQVGYYRYTACTDSIVSVGTLNTLDSVYICAESVVSEDYSPPLSINLIGPCPSSTPTPSITPSVTPTVSLSCTPITQTPTPTYTQTPTCTPSAVYMRNLRTGGWYQDVCNSVNQFANPANVTVFTTKPFNQLVVGDHVYGDKELTIPPINANFTICDGGYFVQLAGTLVINTGNC